MSGPMRPPMGGGGMGMQNGTRPYRNMYTTSPGGTPFPPRRPPNLGQPVPDRSLTQTTPGPRTQLAFPRGTRKLRTPTPTGTAPTPPTAPAAPPSSTGTGPTQASPPGAKPPQVGGASLPKPTNPVDYTLYPLPANRRGALPLNSPGTNVVPVGSMSAEDAIDISKLFPGGMPSVGRDRTGAAFPINVTGEMQDPIQRLIQAKAAANAAQAQPAAQPTPQPEPGPTPGPVPQPTPAPQPVPPPIPSPIPPPAPPPQVYAPQPEGRPSQILTPTEGEKVRVKGPKGSGFKAKGKKGPVRVVPESEMEPDAKPGGGGADEPYSWTMMDLIKRQFNKDYQPPALQQGPPMPPGIQFRPMPQSQEQGDPAADAVRKALERAGLPNVDPNAMTQEDINLMKKFPPSEWGDLGQSP